MTDLILMTEQEAADFLALERETLRKWRQRGVGPGFYRLQGRTIRYSQGELVEWLEAQRDGGRAA